MKFCYLDESGTGGQPVAVMVGVIADAQRMHLTKAAWSELLTELSKLVGQELQEFHAHRFYSGSGVWKELDGEERSSLIAAIIKWMKARKHKIVYSAIDQAVFKKKVSEISELKGMSIWKTLALHSVLAIQRSQQAESKNKGNTVLVFDEAVKEKQRFTKILLSPPDWTDEYYSRKRKQAQLDQIVDVPHFVDSKLVPLVQVADLYAFLLRRYFSLSSGLEGEKYRGESEKVAVWAREILNQTVGSAHIFPKIGVGKAAKIFLQMCPQCHN
ncbi:DUF3800 domain-containing protein [Oleiagrimonas sp. MCCC 1A03011]|uniref:DUF3800 domain-containing protein n=1 Tax=Oleiagrimonas sp. MCCC 1A03011 TaxID=1926883 RepID=UPI000DC42656|nr:DUF3800 domain-containing protein [Oleiagrimonas sp. MCCC 1A03011]RAP57145.1 hypothetical protein BTJ49_11325 [Oleiagrimonas sp. MCCC 1A03011]